MPRRILFLLSAVVLALHWLLLGGMPLGATNRDDAQRLAFHTRMVTPPPAPEPSPVDAPPEPATPPPAPSPSPPPKPKPKPTRPRPQPQPAPPVEPAPDTAPEHLADEDLLPQRTPTPEDALMQDASGTVVADAAAPETPASAAIAPAVAASTPASAASAAPAAAASAPEQPQDELSAGVDIQPPGASGSQASTEPPPVQLPPSTTLNYAVEGEVKKFRYNVSGELSFQRNGDSYEARQEVSAFLIGTRSQTSKGHITPNGLAPTRFGDKGKREVAAHFDFDKGEVIFSASSSRIAVTAGAQDRVSVLIQMGAMMAAAPDRYPKGTQISFTTIGPRNADRWTFTVGDTETLDLPAGPTTAVHLKKLPRHERDLTADLWLGTQYHYLPVRLRITQSNGDYADLSLK